MAVVDDEGPVRTALRRLRLADFDVETFPSAAELLESWQARQPGCAVLDLYMQQVNGFSVQARLGEAGI
jgi:FixJ family two-component response regulator